MVREFEGRYGIEEGFFDVFIESLSELVWLRAFVLLAYGTSEAADEIQYYDDEQTYHAILQGIYGRQAKLFLKGPPQMTKRQFLEFGYGKWREMMATVRHAQHLEMELGLHYFSESR
jgi:hypothetical protein